MPRDTRLAYIAQEAPSGSATPFETVLAADTERAALLAESETCHDPDRLGDIHDRLIAIDAYSAPARAGRILVGLGFDEEMQRSEEHTSELQSLMRISYAVFCLKKTNNTHSTHKQLTSQHN